MQEPVLCVNSTYIFDLEEPVAIEKIPLLFASARITGKCERITWNIGNGFKVQIVISGRRSNKTGFILIMKNEFNQTSNYIDYLDVLLRLNTFFHISREDVPSKILELYPEVTYCDRMFHSVTWKLKSSTALVYSSGKVVLLGCKSLNQVNSDAKFLICQLQGEQLITPKPLSYKPVCVLKNMVKSGTLINHDVKLDDLFYFLRNFNHLKGLNHEPELFPALHCTNSGVSCTIFENAKVNLTGCKDSTLIDEVFNDLKNLLEKFVENKLFIDDLMTEFCH